MTALTSALAAARRRRFHSVSGPPIPEQCGSCDRDVRAALNDAMAEALQLGWDGRPETLVARLLDPEGA